jgi:hypothetical protein
MRSNLRVKQFAGRAAVRPPARLAEQLPAMRVLAPPPVRQSGGRLVESAAAEQRRRRSNNRQKLKRQRPAVKMHTIERLRLAYKGAAIQSIECGESGNLR